MRPFAYEQLPLRVVFAAGALERIRDEVRRLGGHRALVLTTPGRRTLADEIGARLGDDGAGVFAEAVVHVPTETARAAQDLAGRVGADCLLAVGGGSTVGLAKAVALQTALPILAVPTTYAGSEMTPIYGLTEGGVKKIGRDVRVLPKTVVYDPSVTLSLPANISASSGLNAIAHSVEALYAADANPITSMLSAESIRVLARSLSIVVTDPSNLDARCDALYGACLAGAALAATSMGLHHKLCHAVGGAFKLPHAEVHAVILPHATAFNREAAPGAMRVIADALGARDAAQGIYDLAARLGAPLSLAQIGMPADGLERAARIAVERPYDNPRPVEYDGIRRLLDDAYLGRRPA